MTKRFGRPAPSFDAKPSKGGIVRQINLPREGNALEGLYAEAAARGEMATAPYDAISKESFNRSLLFWIVVALFWLAVAFSLVAPSA